MNGARRVYVIVGAVLVLALIAVLMSGCAMLRGRIKGDGVTVQGAKDANGVSLAQGKSGEVLPLPAGSKLVIARTEAMEAIPATQTTPGQPAKAATEVVEVVVSQDTAWRRDKTEVMANTGVIDQTVALRRIQTAENRYLLFAAIGAAVAGGFFLYIKYPTPALMCGGASVVFFLAWRLSGLPDYFWVIGVIAGAGAFFLWRGHSRGEGDGIKAAISGEVEPKNPPVVKS